MFTLLCAQGGKTAIDLAREQGKYNIIQILEHETFNRDIKEINTIPSNHHQTSYAQEEVEDENTLKIQLHAAETKLREVTLQMNILVETVAMETQKRQCAETHVTDMMTTIEKIQIYIRDTNKVLEEQLQDLIVTNQVRENVHKNLLTYYIYIYIYIVLYW